MHTLCCFVVVVFVRATSRCRNYPSSDGSVSHTFIRYPGSFLLSQRFGSEGFRIGFLKREPLLHLSKLCNNGVKQLKRPLYREQFVLSSEDRHFKVPG